MHYGMLQRSAPIQLLYFFVQGGGRGGRELRDMWSRDIYFYRVLSNKKNDNFFF